MKIRYAAFALGLALAACGGGEKADEGTPVPEAAPPAAAPAPDTAAASMDSTMVHDTTTTKDM